MGSCISAGDGGTRTRWPRWVTRQQQLVAKMEVESEEEEEEEIEAEGSAREGHSKPSGKKKSVVKRKKSTRPEENEQPALFSDIPFDLFKVADVRELVAFHACVEKETDGDPFIFEQYMEIVKEMRPKEQLVEGLHELFQGFPSVVQELDNMLATTEDKDDNAENYE